MLSSRYNPNGVFLAVEGLDYLLMSLTRVSLAPVFTHGKRAGKVLCGLRVLHFVATTVALAIVFTLLGMDHGGTFEIAVITTLWVALIVGGPLRAVVFSCPDRRGCGRRACSVPPGSFALATGTAAGSPAV